MQKKRATLNDIAGELGISRTAVSMALRGKPSVSKEMREKIFEAANRFGYEIPETPEENVLNNKICVILAEEDIKTREFFSKVICGIEDESRSNGFDLFISIVKDELHNDIISKIKNSEIDGIILISRDVMDFYYRFTQYNVPVVLIDNHSYSLPYCAVLIDNFNGGYMLATHLIEKGHRKIGFIGPTSLQSFRERWYGYHSALDEAGIELRGSYCITRGFHRRFEDVDELRTDLEKMAGDMPTSFVCANDLIAITVIHALAHMGISVPGDVSIVGFDNESKSEIIIPKLTTMDIDKEYMGKEAVRKLLQLINGGQPKSNTVIKPTIVERNSVKDLG